MTAALVVLAAIVVVYAVHWFSYRQGWKAAEWQADLADTMNEIVESVELLEATTDDAGRSHSESNEKVLSAISKQTAALEKLDTNIGGLLTMLNRGRHLVASPSEGQPSHLGPTSGGGWGGGREGRAAEVEHPGPPASLTRPEGKPGLEEAV